VAIIVTADAPPKAVETVESRAKYQSVKAAPLRRLNL
jgi:hypothetical protein